MAPPVAPTATVTFSYHSPVARDQAPLDPEGVTGCVHHYAALGGSFVLSGSWAPETNYRNPQGDCYEQCTLVVSGIPANTEHVVRMWDLGLCNIDASQPPLSYGTFWANSVELVSVIERGGMTGAAFTVSPTGAVTP